MLVQYTPVCRLYFASLKYLTGKLQLIMRCWILARSNRNNVIILCIFILLTEQFKPYCAKHKYISLIVYC